MYLQIQVSITVEYLDTSASNFQAFELSQIFSFISCIQICCTDFTFVIFVHDIHSNKKAHDGDIWWTGGLSFTMKFSLK